MAAPFLRFFYSEAFVSLFRREAWTREGGYREVLKIALPMVIGTGSWSFQQFIERVFLTWHSPEAVAAAMPSALVSFMFISLFLGTVTYANTFVAQYKGAAQHHRVGGAVWQAIHLSIFAGILMLCLIPLAEVIFELAGHAPGVQRMEVVYFQILCIGAAPTLVSSAASTLFTGLGKTKVVMWVNLFFAGVFNTVLSWAWIFGKWGLPEWGIRGAGWATVSSHVASSVVFLALMSMPHYRKTYHTLKAWRPDPALFRRLLRFGLPSGVQFSLDIGAFSIFLLMVGRFGTASLAATNIAFNISALSFMPMLGLGIAISTLVGQRLGQNRPDVAERSAISGVRVAYIYMGSLGAVYVTLPDLFLFPFAMGADPEAFESVRELTVILLRFVAIYCLFDAMFLTYASAIKGAGDTRFVLIVTLALGWGVMAIPSYVAWQLGFGLYAIWGALTVYIVAAGTVCMLRFRGGKWKSMRVIEEVPREISK